MPAQLSESVTFVFDFTVAGVPTSGLSPAPVITIYSPAGVALVSAAAMTEQVTPARYIYAYTLPNVAGLYEARAFSSQANLDSQYMSCGLEVGQAWIQDLDAAVSSRSTYAGGAVASVTGNVGGNVLGSVGSLAAQAQTDVQNAMTGQGYTTTRAGYLDILNGLLTAIWSYTTRILTAGTNIVLAKGVGVTGFNDVSTAQVKAQVVDALTVDTYAEPTTVVGATATIKDMLNWIKLLGRNKLTQTATQQKVYADNGSTVIGTSTVSDDGSIATRGKAS